MRGSFIDGSSESVRTDWQSAIVLEVPEVPVLNVGCSWRTVGEVATGSPKNPATSHGGNFGHGSAFR